MKVVVLVSEMVVGLELELQVVHKAQLVGWDQEQWQEHWPGPGGW